MHSCSSTKLDDYSTFTDITSLLASFTDGTKNAKLCPKPPKRSDLGPIKSMGRIMKPGTTAIKLIDEIRNEILVTNIIKCTTEGIASKKTDGTTYKPTSCFFPFDNGVNHVGTVTMKDFFCQECSGQKTKSATIMGDSIGHNVFDNQFSLLNMHQPVLQSNKTQKSSELRDCVTLTHTRTKIRNTIDSFLQ